MGLRSAYVPPLPEMDSFLFAQVGEEVAGVPLSVLSALAQLGLDPRDEAARLSLLTSKAAASQLAGMFRRLPDRPWTPPEILKIAKRLVELLPAAQKGAESNHGIAGAKGRLGSRASPHLIRVVLALSGALVAGLMFHSYIASEHQPTGQAVFQSDPMTPRAPLP